MVRQTGWETKQDFLFFQHDRLVEPKILMMILGFARRPKDIRVVVQTMRDHGINVIGLFHEERRVMV